MDFLSAKMPVPPTLLSMLVRRLRATIATGVCVLSAFATPALAEAAERAQVRTMTSGNIRATKFGITPTGPCIGFIAEAPHYTLELSERARVDIRVVAGADTTLIVVDSSTQFDRRPTAFCNDDVDGQNPGLSHVLEPGRYLIWVGTYDPGIVVHFSMNLDVRPAH